MNVLVCLLSDQHVPNLLSVHHFRPDQLVLVESPAMRQRNAARHFLNALLLGGLEFVPGQVVIAPLESEESFDAIRASLRSTHAMFPNATWTVNLTGGTKPMSIIAYEFFRAIDGRCVYTNVADPGSLQFVDTRETEALRHRLTIKEFLAGYGFESAKADDYIAEVQDRAIRWYECSREIASLGPTHAILNLSDEERAKGRDRGWQFEPRHIPSNLPFPSIAIEQAFGLPENATGMFSRKLSKYEIEFLTGGWLEVFFYGLLNQLREPLRIDDVSLGVEVRRQGDKAGNDLDVAFMRDQCLHVVECKSGSQHHDKSGVVLYKIEAVAKQFRALRVRSYLASTGRNLLTSTGEIRPHLQARAAIYNCQMLTVEAIVHLAKSPTPEEACSVLALPSQLSPKQGA